MLCAGWGGAGGQNKGPTLREIQEQGRAPACPGADSLQLLWLTSHSIVSAETGLCVRFLWPALSLSLHVLCPPDVIALQISSVMHQADFFSDCLHSTRSPALQHLTLSKGFSIDACRKKFAISQVVCANALLSLVSERFRRIIPKERSDARPGRNVLERA